MCENPKAFWKIELNCNCIACKAHFNILENDKNILSEMEAGTHETVESSEYNVTCPKCQYNFCVDFEY